MHQAQPTALLTETGFEKASAAVWVSVLSPPEPRPVQKTGLDLFVILWATLVVMCIHRPGTESGKRAGPEAPRHVMVLPAGDQFDMRPCPN